MEYTDNNITFKDVVVPDGLSSLVVSAVIYNKDDINFWTETLDSNYLIHCIDINWNNAELYGGINISSTADLLKYLQNLNNILEDKKTNTEITYNDLRTSIVKLKYSTIARIYYASQEEIDFYKMIDAFYLANAIDIIWDSAHLESFNKDLKTTDDFLGIINNLLTKLDNLS